MRSRLEACGRGVHWGVDPGTGAADRGIIKPVRFGVSVAMAEVELYTTMFCPYCTRARALLERRGVAFTDIDINEEPARRGEMVRRAGGRTSVPQIFINGEHIGGSDELAALDAAGADFIMAPEATKFVESGRRWREKARPEAVDPFLAVMRSLARETGAWLL